MPSPRSLNRLLSAFCSCVSGLRIHLDGTVDRRGEVRQREALQPAHDGAAGEHHPLHDSGLLPWCHLLRPPQDGRGHPVDATAEPEQVPQVVHLVARHLVSVDPLRHLWGAHRTVYADELAMGLLGEGHMFQQEHTGWLLHICWR